MKNKFYFITSFLFFCFLSTYAQFKTPKFVPYLKKNGRYIYVTYGDMNILQRKEYTKASTFDTISNKAIAVSETRLTASSYLYTHHIIDDTLNTIFKVESKMSSQLEIDKQENNNQICFRYREYSHGGILNSDCKLFHQYKNNDDEVREYRLIGENRIAIFSSPTYRYGIIDLLGNEILPPVLRNISKFHEGLAVYNNENSCGYLDKDGNEIIKAKYKNCGDFNNGIAEVNSHNYINNYINKKGEEINLNSYLKTLTGSSYFEVNNQYKNLFIIRHRKTTYSHDEQILFLDNKLKKISNFIFQRPSSKLNNDNVKIIKVGDNSISYEQESVGFGIFNFRNNKIIVKPGMYLNKIEDFSDNLYSIQTDEGWGFIDENGSIVIQPKYYKVYPFHNGYAFVKNSKGWLIINKKGDLILPLYDYSEEQLQPRGSSVFENGLIKLQYSYNKEIYMDIAGRVYMEK